MSIRFDPLFRLRHVFSSKMDSLAWLRCAGAGRASLRGDIAPCGDWQSQCAYPQTSDSKFDFLRGKMLTHFILPESLGFSERTPKVLTNLLCGRFVFCWGIEEGIEVLAEPIFVRGVSPFNGRHASCPLLWKCASHPPNNSRKFPHPAQIRANPRRTRQRGILLRAAVLQCAAE